MNKPEINQYRQNYLKNIQNKNKKPVIMIIDDDPTIRMILANIITRYRPDVNIIECENGADAYSKMNEAISLIFTDNKMPVLSGLEFIRKIKSQSAYLGIPVIMVSVEGREEYKNLGKELGAVGWLVKPFEMEQIQEYLNEYL